MKQVMNKLSEKVRVNQDTNAIYKYGNDVLGQVSDLYDVGEFYPVLQIDYNYVEGSSDSVLYKKQIKAFSFYCDSDAWFPNDEGFYVDMNKSGIGTAKNPWRNLTYALSTLYCIATQCSTGRMLQETCFVLHCKGTYNYPVFCDERGYGYRSFNCGSWVQATPDVCNIHTHALAGTSYIPIYIVPWESDVVNFEIDSTKVNVSEELVNAGFSYADLIFGNDTNLVNCNINVISSLYTNTIVCKSIQNGSFSCDVFDNYLDFYITTGGTQYRVPSIVTDVHFSYKNSLESYPSDYDKEIWQWYVSYIDNCTFNTDFCRIKVYPQRITDVRAVTTLSYFPKAQATPLHSLFIQQVNSTTGKLGIDVSSVTVGYDDKIAVPYLYLKSLNNLYHLHTEAEVTYADALTNIIYASIHVDDYKGSYLTNSSFADLGATGFDLILNIHDVSRELSSSMIDVPRIIVGAKELRDVHCDYSYLSTYCDIGSDISNSSPYGASVQVETTATNLSIHSTGSWDLYEVFVRGIGVIYNSSFIGVAEGVGGSSCFTFEDSLRLEGCAINAGEVYCSYESLFTSCDFTVDYVIIGSAHNSIFNLTERLLVANHIDNCICNIDYKTAGYGPVDPGSGYGSFTLYRNASANDCTINIKQSFGMLASQWWKACSANEDSTANNTIINIQAEADPFENNLSCSAVFSINTGGLVRAGAVLGVVSTNIASLLSSDCDGVTRKGLLFCVRDDNVLLQDNSTMYDATEDGWVRVSCE